MACKCTVSGKKCTSEDIPCPDGKDCKIPDLSKAACEIGGGDCAGYCECAYSANPAGCYLTKISRDDKACKCTLDTDKKSCTAEHADCKETGKCSTPDLSDASCALAAGSDCKGYCTCGLTKDGESAKVGCYLKGKAPTGKACKCTKVDTTSCTATVVACPDGKDCKTPDLSKAACELGGGDCAGYCECAYSTNPAGCYLTKVPPTDKACKCTPGADKTSCTAEHVDCKETDKCKTPGLSDAFCALADGGNCDGYCECAYSADPKGCYLTKLSPANKACKCTLGTDKTSCTAEHVDCKETDKCKTPGLSDAFCALADGGNCDGYCACGYSAKDSVDAAVKYGGAAAEGCFLTREAPVGKACKCSKGTKKCTAEVADCKTADKEKDLCKTKPDTSDLSCAIADGGDCNGYCACGYSADPKGCFLTAPAKDEKACKCTLASDKCVGAEGSCKSATSASECKKPDTSDTACKNIADGDCAGYCECEFVTDKGCKIKTGKKAPAKKACKCIKGGSTCTAAVVECLDSDNAKCKTPDDTADACAQGQGDCSGY